MKFLIDSCHGIDSTHHTGFTECLLRKYKKITIKMAYEVIIICKLHMPLYFYEHFLNMAQIKSSVF